MLKAAIDQIYALTLDREPSTPIHPGAPLEKLGNERINRTQDLSRAVSNPWDREGRLIRIEDATIDIGIGARHPSRIGSAQNDSLDAGDLL